MSVNKGNWSMVQNSMVSEGVWLVVVGCAVMPARCSGRYLTLRCRTTDDFLDLTMP
jgi:hypothetical protein